ncbi:ABC transporter ATP-binding protein [Pseudorhodoplanes sp.]|uniref:ABC transporter ATP-binding protein n=1 Tax=Pseudorhodoplanes sp. TaxID=1934341 RepID=UPI003D0A9CFE
MSLLDVENLSISFGGIKAVDGVSFNVEAGEIFSIIGPNGAGKTTLFNLISRIYPSSSGRIALDGVELNKLSAGRLASLGLARTFQNIELFEHSTVLVNLLVGRHCRSRASWWREMLFLPSVERAGIEHRTEVEKVIDFLDLALHRDAVVAMLPYGARKIVELGRALSSQPRLLLLDEPSSGLNPEETEDMAFWISDLRDEMGVTVIMIEHDMNLVNRVSDRVLALDQGRVLTMGTPQDVQAHPDVVRAYLG